MLVKTLSRILVAGSSPSSKAESSLSDFMSVLHASRFPSFGVPFLTFRSYFFRWMDPGVDLDTESTSSPPRTVGWAITRQAIHPSTEREGFREKGGAYQGRFWSAVGGDTRLDFHRTPSIAIFQFSASTFCVSCWSSWSFFCLCSVETRVEEGVSLGWRGCGVIREGKGKGSGGRRVGLCTYYPIKNPPQICLVFVVCPFVVNMASDHGNVVSG